MDENKQPKRMLEQRFLDHIYEGYNAGQRYCFVLGAGASKASGIRTGEEMMREWRDYLKSKGTDYIEDCAQELELKPEDYSPIFSDDHVLKNDDYFTLFDLRFAGKPNAAYAYLEKEMEGKYPSFGYHPLAMLLSNTQNRLIITTNFDSLIEDALYTYTFKHPLVVGHESLASYIVNDTRHPVIAKIHRDLLFQPLNRKKDMEELKNEWVEPLRSALSRYIPIVIGYGGGDRTLMSLLDEINLSGIYWCNLSEPSDEIKRIVSKHNGYLVKILGFDEVMFRIGERFTAEVKFSDPCPYLREQADEQCSLYQKSFQKIKNKYEIRKDSPDKQPLSGNTQDDVLGFVGAINRYDSQQSGETTGNEADAKRRAAEASIEMRGGNLKRSLELYTEAIDLAPDNAEYYTKRSTVLYMLGNYEDALQDDTKAIELDPSNPDYYDSRGITLHAMAQYEDALQDAAKAVELDPSNPDYYNGRGIILHTMARYEDALRDTTKAIELDPSNPDYYYSRCVTLHKIEQYEDALRDVTKAIELDPSNPVYYYSRGSTLHAMGRYEDALRDTTKAIELDPSNPVFYNGRGVTLHEMEQYEDALRNTTKAIELDSSKPDYYYSRGATLYAMEQYEDALRNATKAIELDSSNAKYHRDRAATWRKLGREDKALEDEAKALELE